MGQKQNKKNEIKNWRPDQVTGVTASALHTADHRTCSLSKFYYICFYLAKK